MIMITRKLTYNDFHVVADLQKSATSDLGKDMFEPSTDVQIEQALKSGYSCGIFIAGRIIAYTLVIQPFKDTYIMDSCVVHKRWRGDGLQTKTLEYIKDKLISRGGVIKLQATVAPKNKASLRSFEKVGYKVVDVVQMYGGHDRCIVECDI